MAKVSLTDSLRTEYEQLFTACVIRPGRESLVAGLINTLVANRANYDAVETSLGVPWHFVAVVHNMESSQNFRRHLHNGDPLTARTVQVPAGRPKTGNPPFTWEQSAADALAMKGLGAGTDWSVATTLYELERYNGFGYRQFHPQVFSPYLWSFSNHYTRGKYVADGTWSDGAVSAQCGAATLLRRMAELHFVEFADQPLPTKESPPLVVSYSKKKPTDPTRVAQAVALQNWLSTHAGTSGAPDAITGPRTSDAYRMVTGRYLPGDPRAK